MNNFSANFIKAIFVFAGTFFIGCKQNEKAKKENFLPVTDFILSEIKNIDSFPYGLTRYTTQNNKTDTSYINRETFKSLIADFISINISDKKYKNRYEETAFSDSTLDPINIVYTNTDGKLPINMITLYYSIKKNNWEKIYMKYFSIKNDTSVQKTLLWYKNKYCIIGISKRLHDWEEEMYEKIVWNPE